MTLRRSQVPGHGTMPRVHPAEIKPGGCDTDLRGASVRCLRELLQKGRSLSRAALVVSMVLVGGVRSVGVSGGCGRRPR